MWWHSRQSDSLHGISKSSRTAVTDAYNFRAERSSKRHTERQKRAQSATTEREMIHAWRATNKEQRSRGLQQAAASVKANVVAIRKAEAPPVRDCFTIGPEADMYVMQCNQLLAGNEQSTSVSQCIHDQNSSCGPYGDGNYYRVPPSVENGDRRADHKLASDLRFEENYALYKVMGGRSRGEKASLVRRNLQGSEKERAGKKNWTLIHQLDDSMGHRK